MHLDVFYMFKGMLRHFENLEFHALSTTHDTVRIRVIDLKTMQGYYSGRETANNDVFEVIA